MAKRKPVRSVVVVSDTHSGCRLALFNPHEKVRLDDGGFYRPSEVQEKMWTWWRQFWDEWVPEVTKGEPYHVVHNGDAIEGVHHGATTQISQNIKDQLRIARSVMEPEVKRCHKLGGTYYHIRGTAAHVGQSSIWDDDLAESLGAKPNDQGQHARYDLWLRVGGPDGPLVNFLHHIGTTSSAAHETSAVNAELSALYNEAARWKQEPPRYVVRSHRHRFSAITVPSAGGRASAIVTPGWQLKTPFAWKIAGARISEPQLGGIMIRHGEGTNYYREQVWSLQRSRTE